MKKFGLFICLFGALYFIYPNALEYYNTLAPGAQLAASLILVMGLILGGVMGILIPDKLAGFFIGVFSALIVGLIAYNYIGAEDSLYFALAWLAIFLPVYLLVNLIPTK